MRKEKTTTDERNKDRIDLKRNKRKGQKEEEGGCCQNKKKETQRRGKAGII